MKRILILTILLMSSLAWAGSTTVVVGQGGGGEACSGTHGNNATSDAGYVAPAADVMLVRQFVITCTGTPATINYRNKYGNGNVKFLIYSDSGSEPSTNLYTSAGQAIGNPQSNTTITDSSCDYELTPGTYYIGVVADVGNRVYYSSATGGTAWNVMSSGSYTTPPASWPTATDEGRVEELEIWLTF